MRNLLNECRTRFGDPPRSLSFMARLEFRIFPPLWCSLSNDPLLGLYDNQKRLRDRGRVIWGHIVQANSLLFEPGRQNFPANVIYEPHPMTEDNYESLTPVAQSICNLKG